MPITLICSAPHQLCPVNTKMRMCDLAAGTAIQMFQQVAQRQKKLECIYLLGDEFRVDYDLNRKISRKTLFRKKLNQLFEDFSHGNSAVIDIHSFPDKYLIEAGDINFFKQGEIPPELVLLEGPLDEFRDKSLCNTLYTVLIKKKVKCKIIRGITVNDIMNNASEHNIPGILLEFNEKFNDFPDRLYDICVIIVDVLSSL